MFLLLLVSFLVDLLDFGPYGYSHRLSLNNGYALTCFDAELRPDISDLCGWKYLHFGLLRSGHFSLNTPVGTNMPPKRGKGTKPSRGPWKSSTVKCPQKTFVETVVVDTAEEAAEEIVDTDVLDTPDEDPTEVVYEEPTGVVSGINRPVSTPVPCTKKKDEQCDSSSGGSLPSLTSEACGASGKRDYFKSDLSSDQEAQLIEWWRENPCLYDKTHKESHNTKYKELLKREVAQKMGITGKFLMK